MKKYIGVVIIFFVWFLFAYPFFLQNKVPFPSDYQTAYFSPWSAYPEFFSPVKNESMPDVIGQIYPWRYFTIETWKNLSVPLWNPNSFGGTPHLANYQSAVLSPLNIGFFVFSFVDWWSFLILLQPLLAGLFTYAFMRSLKVSKEGSVLSSISFMFCGFITSWMAYGTLGFAVLYIPLALFAVEKFFENKKSRYLALLSFSVPLSFFSGHFQISLYFLLTIFLYIIFKYLQTRNIKNIVSLLCSIFFGILISLPQLLPSVEFYSQSFRSTIFQKIEVIPWGYVPTLLAPDFFGNPVTRNAWFGHYAEWNMYVGLIPILLVGYSFVLIKKPIVLFFVFLGCLSLLLAFPTPLQDLLVFLKIPVFSTSALSRIIVLFSFSAAILSGFGLTQLLFDIHKKKYKKLFAFFSISFVLFLILWLVVVLKIGLNPEHAQIAKSNMRLPSVLLAGFFATCMFGLFFRKRKVGVLVASLIIAILVLDMLRFANKWMPFEPKDLVFPDTVVMNYKAFPTHDRVFGNFGAEGSVYYQLPILEGYDAVYIRRFGQFIASLDSGKLSDSARSGVDLPLAGKNILPAANFLGIKYFIHKVSDGQNVWEFPFWKYDPESIKLVFDDSKYQILENTNAYPRAFMVDNVIVESNPQKILDTMFDEKTNLRTTAVIEEKHPYTVKFASGSAEITSYTPNRIEIVTNVPPVFGKDSASLLVLTDIFYPGWKAYMYDEHANPYEVKIYRTDFAFRGVFVPDQSHRVTFVYEPVSFRYGVYAAIIGFVGVGGLCFALRKRHN